MLVRASVIELITDAKIWILPRDKTAISEIQLAALYINKIYTYLVNGLAKLTTFEWPVGAQPLRHPLHIWKPFLIHSCSHQGCWLEGKWKIVLAWSLARFLSPNWNETLDWCIWIFSCLDKDCCYIWIGTYNGQTTNLVRRASLFSLGEIYLGVVIIATTPGNQLRAMLITPKVGPSTVVGLSEVEDVFKGFGCCSLLFMKWS